MENELDIEAMVNRFRDRAAAVKKRDLPPIGGEERQRFMDQAQVDYQDYAMIGDSDVNLENGVLTLRIDLRPAIEK